MASRVLPAFLAALQTAAITEALPFSVVMIFMMIGLVKSLRTEEEVGA
jgi:choline/glycine/proline betaine transport protein